MEKYDIIVVGGGIAGSAAALSAAREGKNVLLIEKSNALGGAASGSLVLPFMPYSYTDPETGEKVPLSQGIFTEIVEELRKFNSIYEYHDREFDTSFHEEYLKLILNRMLIKDGVKLLFHSYLTEAETHAGHIISVTVTNKSGKQTFYADYFIDATGDGDLASLSGCSFRLGRESDGLCQPMTLCFRVGNVVLPDRCMDIAQTFYRGRAVSWISKTGITSPQYYDKDGKQFLRGFFGGLITTCGLKNIGRAYGNEGLHGRIGNTPAEKVSVSAQWQGNDYIMTVSGTMRENSVFGENLLLKRTITAKLFDDTFTVEDTVINEGFENAEIALCYHCNFGYPLVKEGARIINVPPEIADIYAPIHGKEDECIEVSHSGDFATAGIENGEMGAYITYKRDTMPEFLVWKMLGESEYVVALEPRTTNMGGENIVKKNAYVTISPFSEYKTYLKFEFKEIV